MKQLVRPLITVASGTVVAQGLAFLSMLYLARVYTPNEFGALAGFSALIYIFGVLATLRYDQAVMLPRINSRARSVVVLAALICSVFCSLLVLGGLLLDIGQLASAFNISSLSISTLPLAISLFSITSVLLTWQNRQESYRTISLHRILLTASTAIFQIILGIFFQLSEFGLIAGFILGYAVSLPVLVAPFARQYQSEESRFLPILSLAVRYQNFPKINFWDGILNQFSNNIQSILLMQFYSPTIVGYVAVGQKMFTAPFSILSEALRMVVYRQLAKQRNASENPMNVFRFVGVLLAISLPPSILVAIYAGDIFSIILGEEWREAGRYTALLFPMYIMQFSVSPFVAYFTAMEEQTHGLIWNLCRAILSIFALFVGWVFLSAPLSVFLYGVAHASMYGVLLIYLYKMYTPAKVKAV